MEACISSHAKVMAGTMQASTVQSKCTGGMTAAPSRCSASRWAAVKGLSHMKVFIAGATRSGREKSQALNCSAPHAIEGNCGPGAVDKGGRTCGHMRA